MANLMDKRDINVDALVRMRDEIKNIPKKEEMQLQSDIFLESDDIGVGREKPLFCKYRWIGKHS